MDTTSARGVPVTPQSAVLRTDYSDDRAWSAVRNAMLKTSPEGFAACLDFIEDRAFDGMHLAAVLAAVPPDYPHSFLLIVDAETLQHPEHPVLVVELRPRTGAHFRVVPAEVWGVENNLSLANMDFKTFAAAAGADGVFRGF